MPPVVPSPLVPDPKPFPVRWCVGAVVAVAIAVGLERSNTTRPNAFPLGAYVAMLVVAFVIGTVQRASAWSIGLLMMTAYSYSDMSRWSTSSTAGLGCPFAVAFSVPHALAAHFGMVVARWRREKVARRARAEVRKVARRARAEVRVEPPKPHRTALRPEPPVRWIVGAAVAVCIAAGMELCFAKQRDSLGLGTYLVMTVVAFAIGTMQRSGAWAIGALLCPVYWLSAMSRWPVTSTAGVGCCFSVVLAIPHAFAAHLGMVFMRLLRRALAKEAARSQ